MSKPYQSIEIQECGEPVEVIPQDEFAFFDPPPYAAMGADYGGESPWKLRQGILKRLKQAQIWLQQQKPGWRIMFFDAFRPNTVQIYMVEREFGIKARQAGYDAAALTPEQRAQLAEKVFDFWAMPSDNPLTPPPHSTGAAMDITLQDEHGHEVDMGAPIDEGAPPAVADYFATATDPKGQRAHTHRMLLSGAMRHAGFRQHPGEWWHFSYGDQIWAWLENQTNPSVRVNAIYGRADLL